MASQNGTSTILVAFLLLPLLAAVPTTARVVDSMESFDLFDSSILSSSEWVFTNQAGWSGDAADFTTGMSADSKVSFTHSRPLNLESSTFWAQENTSEYGGGAVGAPDGVYSWTLGPEIVVDTFDVSTVENTAMRDVFLVVSFTIPDALNQDSVRFSIDDAGHNELVKTWAHTQAAVNKMNSPYWEINVSSSFDWTWSIVSGAKITLDYASVGGTDDSQLQIDAVGIRVVHQKSSWGVETSVAELEIPDLQLPIMDLNMTNGDWQGLTLTSCGLEASSQGVEGTWTSTVVQRPHGQNWGRISTAGTWTGSLELSSSNDALSWSAWSQTAFSSILPASEYLQIKVKLSDGCVERVRLDINDPTLHISINVHGDTDSIISNGSRIQVSMQNELIHRFDINTVGTYSHSVSIGDTLPADGESLMLHLASAFTWNDGGDAKDLVVEVTELKIDGGYSLSWDDTPDCDFIADLELTEDGSGRILPVQCTDDLTAVEDLEMAVSSSDVGIIEADIIEGQVRIKLVPETSGEAVIRVSVMDRPGMLERNTWSQEFTVTVENVNDAPVFSPLASEVLVSLPSTTSIDLEFSDIDNSNNELTVSFDYSWASFESGRMVLQPTAAGEWELTITISDGINTVSQVVTVVAMALPDIYVDSVEISDSADHVEAGDVVEVIGWIRNQGQADADFISVRCLADGQLFDVAIIDLVAPGQLRRVVCDWQVPTNDDVVLLTVVLDHSLTIRESDESNNNASKVISIVEPEITATGGDSVSAGLTNEVKISGAVGLILALIAAFFIFAPKGIRKIE
ncbi:MAG: CARDB domain-containing protein [Candidatus Poseidoniales archaeon]